MRSLTLLGSDDLRCFRRRWRRKRARHRAARRLRAEQTAMATLAPAGRSASVWEGVGEMAGALEERRVVSALLGVLVVVGWVVDGGLPLCVARMVLVSKDEV